MSIIQFAKQVAALECNDACMVLLRTNPSAFKQLEKDHDFHDEAMSLDLAERERSILRYGVEDAETTTERLLHDAPHPNEGTRFQPSDKLDQGTSEAIASVTADELAADRRDEIADAPAPEQLRDPRLRPFHQGKFRFSKLNYYGNRFTGALGNGRDHLVPERHFVQAVIDGHHDGNNSILQRKGIHWSEQIEQAALADPTIGPVLKANAEHMLDMHRGMADLTRLWTGHSFGLRDALQRALARRAHNLVEMIEANDTVANAGGQPADWMVRRLSDTKDYYETSKAEAGYWMHLWRTERELAYEIEKRSRTALNAANPGFDPTPTTNADPDDIRIDYAVTAHLIQWARFQEERMVADPRSQQVRAAQHEKFLDVAL